MFNLAAGNIKLCRSNFTLRLDITPQVIEENLADVIFDRKKINTHFLYYMIWVDIEPHEYIYAEVSFFDNKLQHIRLLPQHQSASTAERQVHSMDLLTAQNLASSWYRKYFSDEKMTFSWGTVTYFNGADPIYSPPCILVKFKQQI